MKNELGLLERITKGIRLLDEDPNISAYSLGNDTGLSWSTASKLKDVVVRFPARRVDAAVHKLLGQLYDLMNSTSYAPPSKDDAIIF